MARLCKQARAPWFWVEKDTRMQSRPRINCIKQLAKSPSADTRGHGSRQTQLPGR